MREGKPFEVSKEVYERAKAHCKDKDAKSFYMVESDRESLFSISIRWGYGLYDCKVREENGKYICTYMTGSSCD